MARSSACCSTSSVPRFRLYNIFPASPTLMTAALLEAERSMHRLKASQHRWQAEQEQPTVLRTGGAAAPAALNAAQLQ